MTPIKCIAFDCFGTVFDMAGVSQDEIAAYVEHVKQDDFSPYVFPQSWWDLRLHPDAAKGVKMLQEAGYYCVTLSNGSPDLLAHVSGRGGIKWDCIVDPAKYKVYKPHEAAYSLVMVETTYFPSETLMVTANPTFGDIEGAAAIGMQSQVIRQPGKIRDIIELAELLQ